MKHIALLIAGLILPFVLVAQHIEWEDVSSEYELPGGLKLYHGTKPDHASFFAYYYEVDMNDPDIAIRPYISSTPMQVHDFSSSVGAYGAVNGGFFAGSASVSSVIFPHEVAARNLTSVVRFGKTYPVIRPIFALNNDRSLSAEWVYHHSYSLDDIYIYDAPMPYACDDPNPLPVPLKEDGYVYENIAYGLGGGPMLIRDGEINITYCEEIFWGSGVYLTDYRPRTAVGYTAGNKVIIFVTNHMKIGDMAGELLELGCFEAMNLDGGGSTAMALGEESIYDQNRPVPTILAVVHTDSLNIPQTPTYEEFIDTGDEGVTSQGDWFATANEGYWESPSMLHVLGTDDSYYEFPLDLPAAGEYEIYAWWTSHANRSADTPFYIAHSDGVDHVAVDQSIGGSMWNLIGTYYFNADGEENVRITAAATTNQFVVADAIRVVSYDPQFGPNQIASIAPVGDISVPFGTPREEALALLDQQTTITDTRGDTHEVDLFWESASYEAMVPGQYQATGVFELPEAVEQTDPPTPLEVFAQITVEEADDTGLEDPMTDSLYIYPNPGSGMFTIGGLTGENALLQVFGADGRLVYETNVAGRFNKEVHLEAQPAGLYFLRLSGSRDVQSKKFMIR